MSSILDKIVQHKLTEIESAKQIKSLSQLSIELDDVPPALDFVAALNSGQQADQVSLIAEVKKASPSKGVIREKFDPVSIAKTYAQNGASCISVLTDENFFQGSLDYLRAIRSEVAIPLLRKDFVLDEYQVVEARAAGADAVLLIAECLEPGQLKQLHDQICDLGMTPLVELYDAENVESVLACNPQLVGVNNRDLNTFDVDLHHSINVRKQLPDEITFVSESGIYSNDDVQLMQQNNVDAVLVGESLMRKEDIGQAVRELMGQA